MSANPPTALIASPRQPPRFLDFAQRCAAVLPALERRFSGEFVVPPELDEARFWAVLHGAERGFDLTVALNEATWPFPLRVALVSLSPHLDREALARGKEKAGQVLAAAERDGVAFRFALAGRLPEELHLAEGCALLHSALMEEWTETRAAAVRVYREVTRQREVAERLRVSQQAVSQMLRGAHFRELSGVEQSLRQWLGTPGRPSLWRVQRPPVEAERTSLGYGVKQAKS